MHYTVHVLLLLLLLPPLPLPPAGCRLTFASCLMSSITLRMEVEVARCTLLEVLSAAQPTHSAGSRTGLTCEAQARQQGTGQQGTGQHGRNQ